MATRSVVATDVGRKRQHNEDAHLCDDELGLYIVADGVGGQSKGEIASQEAVDHLHGWVRGHRQEFDRLRKLTEKHDLNAHWEIRRLLETGIQSACYMVFGMASQDPEKRGMSTTLSCVFVTEGACYAAHVGDSRVYRVREGHVLQLTEDHTLINYKLKQGMITVEEAALMSDKNVITRAVGHKDYVQVDTADIDARKSDRFLLCTDGLHGYIQDPKEIASLIGEGSLESGVSAAIGLANQRGGKDNITAIAIEVY